MGSAPILREVALVVEKVPNKVVSLATKETKERSKALNVVFESATRHFGSLPYLNIGEDIN